MTDDELKWDDARDDFAAWIDKFDREVEWEGDRPEWHRDMMFFRQMCQRFGSAEIGGYSYRDTGE
jgi:hypothetical protein